MANDDAKDLAIRLTIDYHQTFGSPEGKRVLLDLERESSFRKFNTLPKGKDGHTDMYAMAFREGQRRIVARIIHKMNADPYAKKGIKHDNG